MELSFNAEQIEDWASFSGDRNPIHFDEAAAAKLGVDRVVAHGMLALLPVKQHLAEISANDASYWTQFKALFKAPILRDDVVTLTTRDRPSKVSFKVNSGEKNQHLIGNMSQIDPKLWASDSSIYDIPDEEIRDKFDRFYSVFKPGFDHWIWLDGLIFGHFIRHQIGLVYSKLSCSANSEKKVSTIEDLTDHLVVQISHQTSFKDQLKGEVFSRENLPSISYQLDNFEISEEKESAFGTVEIGVLVNGVHDMSVELGLMIINKPSN